MPQGWTDIAPQEAWPWLLICAGIIGLAVIILLITLIVRKREPAERANRTSHVTPAQQRTLERDVSSLIAALSEMAQAVGSELDERALRLEKLLAAADERIRDLEGLSNDHDGASRIPTTTASATPVATNDPRHAEIYALADRGLPAVDIAKNLARPKGEIELILALRPRRAG
jgi:hypothetical protein